MKINIFKQLLLLGVFIAVSFMNLHKAEAIYMDLMDDQIVEAINMGNRNSSKDLLDFLSPWIVSMPDTKNKAMLNTEFLALAFESKLKALDSSELTERDIDDILARSRGRLVFSVTLYGSNKNFAKDNEAVILVNDEEIIASFSQNGTGKREGRSSYASECSYWFPSKGISPDDKIILLVTNAMGQEYEFTFNLASMQ